MAIKRITELPLIEALTGTANFAIDNTIQAYRATAEQIKTFVLLNNTFMSRSFRSISNPSSSAITTSDTTIAISGSSGSVVLPTAVGNEGRRFKIIHNGTSLTDIYIVNTTSSQTIGGVTAGEYRLCTFGEVLEVESDGANWLIVGRVTDTPWINSGTVIIGAITSNPTKGSAQSIDKIWWKRSGDSAHIRFRFSQTNNSGAAAGSGDYLFQLPSNIAIDSNKIDYYAVSEGWDSAYGNSWSIGTGGFGNGSTQSEGTIVPYDSTRVRIFTGTVGATSGVPGSAAYQLTGASVFYSGNYIVPVTNWRP